MFFFFAPFWVISVGFFVVNILCIYDVCMYVSISLGILIFVTAMDFWNWNGAGKGKLKYSESSDEDDGSGYVSSDSDYNALSDEGMYGNGFVILIEAWCLKTKCPVWVNVCTA